MKSSSVELSIAKFAKSSVSSRKMPMWKAKKAKRGAEEFDKMVYNRSNLQLWEISSAQSTSSNNT